MITINEEIDWITIRQALSLSMLTGKEIKICDVSAYLDANPEYQPIMSDICQIIEQYSLGKLSISDKIIFTPGSINYGNYYIKTNQFSSISEIILLLLPSLSSLSFRSYIEITGVSHSGMSYPTNFLNETMLTILESIGFYASTSLKRFGFYGSGGGVVESKIYPLEKTDKRFILDISTTEEMPEIIGGRIYISGMDLGIANREKEMLSKRLGLDDRKISIIDVRDSDGMGNVLQIYIKFNNLPVIFSKVVDIYNQNGDFIFQDDDIKAGIDDLVDEVKNYLGDKILPEYALRELIPYLKISGFDIYAFENYHTTIKKTINLMEKI